MSLRWVAYRLEVQQTPKKTHNLYNYIFLKGAIEWFITGFAKVISWDCRTNMLPLFSYYCHHSKRTFGRLWETEKSDYLATNSAREDKKQKLLIFVKCQRKEPFLSGIAPFRCRIPPPMRHLGRGMRHLFPNIFCIFAPWLRNRSHARLLFGIPVHHAGKPLMFPGMIFVLMKH